MTVKEIKKLLANKPDDYVVDIIDTERFVIGPKLKGDIHEVMDTMFNRKLLLEDIEEVQK